MQTFKTQGCTAHGQPEVTLQFASKSPVPNGERLLLSYFQNAVARGERFLPGQTVGIGAHVLRLISRPDGTLGVEEPVPSPREEWVEQVDRTVREVMFQRYVCDSVGLPLSFPPLRGTFLSSDCAEKSEVWVMTRVPREPDLPPHFSGWMVSCSEEHDHGERRGLPLLALSAMRPFAVQFLALPEDSVVLLMPPGRGVVFHRGQELTPAPGSYLEMLNAR